MGNNSNQRTIAIMSKQLEDAIGKELRLRRETYYIFYRLSIETGLPATRLVNFKVSDIRNKTSLKVPSRRSTDTSKSTEVNLSEELISDIKHFIRSMNDNDYLFVGLNGNRIQTTTINRALINASTKCGAHDISILSLKKTYVYHELQRTQDINYIRRNLKLSSNRAVYQYIGLDYYPMDNSPLSYIKNTVNDSIIENTYQKVQQTFERLLANKDQVRSNEETQKILSFINAISGLIDVYNT